MKLAYFGCLLAAWMVLFVISGDFGVLLVVVVLNCGFRFFVGLYNTGANVLL